MSLKKYLKAIAGTGAVSESALYTTIATNLLSNVLHYEPKFYEINKSNKAGGIPDIRLHAGDEDNTEWIVCEVKLDDTYSTWTYDNKNRQRMLVTDPLIFLSTSRLTWVGKAEHKVRKKA